MTRAKLLWIGGALLMTTGCELPMPGAEGGRGGVPIPAEGYEAMDDYTVPLDVTVVSAAGQVGAVELGDASLVATGSLYGTSTRMQVQADPAQLEPGALDALRSLEITVDLCPIEDILVNGADTTAFLAVYVCQGGLCQDATFAMEVDVAETEARVRAITVDTRLDDGSPLHLELQYTSPL